MKLNYHKYRKEFAALTLLSYLFLVALSIFHYHHVDILEGNYALESSFPDTGSNPFDKLIDSTHECTIQQFASTVINYSFTNVFDIVITDRGQSFNKNKPLLLESEPHYNSNPHRAPPLFI